MATITLNYDVHNAQAQKALDFILSLGIFTEKKKEAKKSEMYYRLDNALADVRLMMDGKKRKKTAQEFLEEIRNGK